MLTSREMDRIEEEELVPAKKVLYQFSARGHDMAQVLLGLHLKDGDGVVRLLSLAAAAAVARRPARRRFGLRDGACRRLFRRARYRRRVQLSEPGRRPRPADVRRGRRAIYAGGRLGAGDRIQAAGTGKGSSDSISLVLGGDASCATGGFWSALTIATTQQLPLLIYIEDNGYGIRFHRNIKHLARISRPISRVSTG